ncbi:hypothetical protein Nmel_010336 [Mimus melanotis]
MERTSLHNDSLLYASLIAILLLISYWFTTRCFKIISGIEAPASHNAARDIREADNSPYTWVQQVPFAEKLP